MKVFVILLFLSILVGFAYAYEPVPAGIEVIEYGIFDKDGNVVHQLRADQPYQINVHFESELDVSVSFTYHVQILDKNKHWTEPVEEFNSSGILQPNEEKTISFEWIPKYDGKFRTLVGFGNNEDDTAIGSVPQYDFEVASEITPPLKQIQSGITFNEIQCKENLILLQKYDGTPACVTEQTKQKLIERGWTSRPNEVIVIIPEGSANPEKQFHLIPKHISVIMGINNTVTWVNHDKTPSTLVADQCCWGTKKLLPKEKDSITFNQTGIYDYHGEPHPWKTGTIIVLDKNGNMPNTLEIREFNDIQKAGKIISFVVRKTGFGGNYTVISQIINIDSNEIVDEYSYDRTTNDQDEPFEHRIEFPIRLSRIAVDEVGDYLLRVESDGKVIEKSFKVIEGS